MDTSIDVGELAEETVRITREMRHQLDAARAEVNGLRLQNGLLRQERDAALARAEKAEAQRDAVAAALEQTLAFIEGNAESLDATCDNWPCVIAARAALALVRE